MVTEPEVVAVGVQALVQLDKSAFRDTLSLLDLLAVVTGLNGVPLLAVGGSAWGLGSRGRFAVVGLGGLVSGLVLTVVADSGIARLGDGDGGLGSGSSSSFRLSRLLHDGSLGGGGLVVIVTTIVTTGEAFRGGDAANLALLALLRAAGAGPSKETVGNVGGVAVSSNATAKVARFMDTAGVIDASSAVPLGGIVVAGLLESLLQAVALGSAAGSIIDHAEDLIFGARVLDAALIASVLAVMVLHETWVADTPVSGWGTHTALGLLHQDSKDELLGEATVLSGSIDTLLDVRDLLVRVVRDTELAAG